MGRPISYEMQMMFVGSPGAFEEAMNTGSGITRLDYIQSYDFSFNIERNPLKQIGSDSFATRQTQFAPDVNLNIQYYLNDGWNDKFIGLDISPDSSGNPFDTILSSTGDRNFYVSIAQDDGIDQNLKTGIVNSNVLGIGNCYITNYEISVSVNELATVSCSFVGGNANVQDYATSKYLPSVNTLSSGQNAEDVNKNFALNFISNARTEEYFSKAKDNFTGGCPYSKCKITPDFQSSSTTSPLTFGFFDAIANNFQSMQFSVQFDRKSLYGFGNNHPYTRKVQRPIVATLALSALIDDFQAENLSKIFHKEGGAKSSILIEFFNFSDVKKFGLALDNLTLESYSLGARIGGRVLVETNWTVEIVNGSGSNVKMIGSYAQRALDSILVNESFGVENLFIDFDSVGANALSKDGRIWNLYPIGKSYLFPDSYSVSDSPYKAARFGSKSFVKISNFLGYSGSDTAAIAIDKNGQAWGIGRNDFGQVGDNTTVNRSQLVPVYGNKTFCQISTGSSSNLALDKNGRAWTWGKGFYFGGLGGTDFGLGDGTSLSRRTPVLIGGSSKTFCSVHRVRDLTPTSYAIDKYGKIWAWGYNGGSFGNGSLAGSFTPVSIHGNKTFCKIRVNSFQIALDNYGKPWVWGYNSGSTLLFPSGLPSTVTTPVAVSTNKTFCEIFAVNYSSNFAIVGISILAIDNRGNGWAWGYNNRGILGNNILSSSTPVPIYGNHNFSKFIYSSAGFIRAIDKYGRSWSWGFNGGGNYGNTPFLSLGPEYQTFFSSFTKLEKFNNKNFSIFEYNLILNKQGKVFSWGENDRGGVGNNSTVFQSTVEPVPNLINKTICKIATAYLQGSAVLDKNGLIWSWGYNYAGRLGDNSTINRLAPVSLAGQRKTFCQITGGSLTFRALDKYGKAWNWGGNSDFSLAAPDAAGSYSKLTPVAVHGNKTFCKIVAGNNFAIALDKNGKAWGWGYCAYGTLGIGAIGTNEYGEPLFRGKNSPVAICGNHTFCEISNPGGSDSTMALDKYGRIWGWGGNSYGELGFFDPPYGSNSYTPRLIAGANKTFCKISIPYAIDHRKKLWRWGLEIVSFGVYPSSDADVTPVQINPNTNFSNIEYQFAVDNNENIFCIGNKLALGIDVTSVKTPVRIYGF